MSEKKREKEKLIIINDIPLIFPERNVVKQMHMEMLLEPDLLLKALNISKIEQVQAESREPRKPDLSYIT